MSRDPFLEEFLMRRNRTKEVADLLGISPAAVSRWTQVPAERAHAIASAFGIELSTIRPDLWPPEALRCDP